MASQITSQNIVYSTVYSDVDQCKHQSPASLASVRGIHRRSVNSLHKWPVTRKMFPFDDIITNFYVDIRTGPYSDCRLYILIILFMITSWHRDAFRITEPLCHPSTMDSPTVIDDFGVSFLLRWKGCWTNSLIAEDWKFLNVHVMLFQHYSCFYDFA